MRNIEGLADDFSSSVIHVRPWSFIIQLFPCCEKLLSIICLASTFGKHSYCQRIHKRTREKVRHGLLLFCLLICSNNFRLLIRVCGEVALLLHKLANALGLGIWQEHFRMCPLSPGLTPMHEIVDVCLTVGTPSPKINIRTHFSHLLYAVLLTLSRKARLTAQCVTSVALLSLHGLSKETQQKITQPNCFHPEGILQQIRRAHTDLYVNVIAQYIAVSVRRLKRLGQHLSLKMCPKTGSNTRAN